MSACVPLRTDGSGYGQRSDIEGVCGLKKNRVTGSIYNFLAASASS